MYADCAVVRFASAVTTLRIVVAPTLYCACVALSETCAETSSERACTSDACDEINVASAERTSDSTVSFVELRVAIS